MGLLKKLKDKIEDREIEKYYDDFNDDYTENSEMKHIWGIKSYDDLSSSFCNLLTMNDFDITYLKNEKKYILGVELIYQFDKGYDGEKAYLEDILDKFTEWMEENGYDTNIKIRIWQFGEFCLNSHFDTIEDAYASFKYMVKGF